MIVQLSGNLLAKTPGKVVLENNGLGIELSIPISTFLNLPELGSSLTLFTRLVIREDSWELFGFQNYAEREFFNLLTTVSKVGPKLALTILSSLSPEELANTIIQKDIGKMSSIKGIGTKTAERLILELKDKIPSLASLAGLKPEDIEKISASSLSRSNLEANEETLMALVSLGYSKNEAEKALKKVQAGATESLSLEESIRATLKLLIKP